MKNSRSIDNNKRKYLFAVIGLLIGLNVFLWYMNHSMKNQHKKLKAQTVEVENAKANLEKAYDDAVAELKVYEGENKRLDSLLNNGKVELEQLKADIQQLLNKDKLTGAELSQAKTMIVNLKLRNQNQINTLDSLYEISQSLARTNINLERVLRTEKDNNEQLIVVADSMKTEYDSLNRTVEKLDKERVFIEKENKQLKSKNEVLLKETESLSQKVDKAAMLQLKNINFSGIRFKNNGKERRTKDYNKVERFKICYQVAPNEFAKSGIKDLLLKITNPEGLVLYDETNDTPGYFVDDNDQEIQYSTVADLDYKNNELQQFCTFSGFNSNLIPGIYAVEIYYKSRKIAVDQLELKNTLF